MRRVVRSLVQEDQIDEYVGKDYVILPLPSSSTSERCLRVMAQEWKRTVRVHLREFYRPLDQSMDWQVGRGYSIPPEYLPAVRHAFEMAEADWQAGRLAVGYFTHGDRMDAPDYLQPVEPIPTPFERPVTVG